MIFHLHGNLEGIEGYSVRQFVEQYVPKVKTEEELLLDIELQEPTNYGKKDFQKTFEKQMKKLKGKNK